MTCAACINDVTCDEKHSGTLISIKDRGGLITPPTSVVDLCLIAEKSVRALLLTEGLGPLTMHKALCTSQAALVSIVE